MSDSTTFVLIIVIIGAVIIADSKDLREKLERIIRGLATEVDRMSR